MRRRGIAVTFCAACIYLSEAAESPPLRLNRGLSLPLKFRGGSRGHMNAPPKMTRSFGSSPRPSVVESEPAVATEDDETGRPPWLPENVPGFIFVFDPVYFLKLRKTFQPLGTKLALGAIFNTQANMWQFDTTWEDKVIGGQLSLKGRELQLSKTWAIPLGEGVDIGFAPLARLRLKLGIDLYSGKTNLRFGFRTEEPSNKVTLADGIQLRPRFPLDSNSHVNVELCTRVAVPTPNLAFNSEIGSLFSSKGSKLDLECGDVYLGIEEVSLCLDY
uniref:Plastid lipid-associated protein/fibrillin conserved domain-containing protein n=1 Tax=Octactis speculum TaxID=3111310 RepID=A0A7S2CEG6_9STRA|mmetsp:Transcript_35013/g.47293  ORF Transcript_35013/g.47293 Transcript_35013/m.47293 type:complete len:274 (+) Transcript_35013:82-903(+)|eukprot:CAMPEP_0185750104 /NCGR_PEP_ID=MMETSP1174-20130828/8820_1 /TAXON_ID=35687 /ORGANISM="Dictyocha speculum, Strain CCMP1381" /LENGTH=273 /DNA_ID=CAMNT_0028426499 /DNA_START=73 /DNA_END=894 /DNA_ORIENTATION=+